MRLIDADDLIEYIKIWEIGNSISSDQKEFIDCVNRQLTVFDVDKVIEQLKDLKAMYWFSIANTGDKKLDVAYSVHMTASDAHFTSIARSASWGAREIRVR